MAECCSLAVQTYGVLSEPVLIRIGEKIGSRSLNASRMNLGHFRERLRRRREIAIGILRLVAG
jgi:hypothetical protein